MSEESILVDDFAKLEKFEEEHKGWLFRGQREPKWELKTSLERAASRCDVDIKKYEQDILREFKRHAHTYLSRTPKDKNCIEWLALMQHYGAPTRLLDFTTSFWIALFNAFEAAECDCSVWALNPSTLGDKNEKDFNKLVGENIENGSHTEDVLYEDVPFYTNERLAIQKGTFVFSMNLGVSFHSLMIKNRKEHAKLVVSKSLFPKIRQHLNKNNCTSRVLFPGIDGYARSFQNYDGN